MVYPIEPQFEARQDSRGWGVYDRWLGSWPVRRPGVGVVAQETTFELAEAAACLLNALPQDQQRVAVDSTGCE